MSLPSRLRARTGGFPSLRAYSSIAALSGRLASDSPKLTAL